MCKKMLKSAVAMLMALLIFLSVPLAVVAEVGVDVMFTVATGQSAPDEGIAFGSGSALKDEADDSHSADISEADSEIAGNATGDAAIYSDQSDIYTTMGQEPGDGEEPNHGDSAEQDSMLCDDADCNSISDEPECNYDKDHDYTADDESDTHENDAYDKYNNYDAYGNYDECDDYYEDDEKYEEDINEPDYLKNDFAAFDSCRYFKIVQFPYGAFPNDISVAYGTSLTALKSALNLPERLYNVNVLEVFPPFNYNWLDSALLGDGFQAIMPLNFYELQEVDIYDWTITPPFNATNPGVYVFTPVFASNISVDAALTTYFTSVKLLEPVYHIVDIKPVTLQEELLFRTPWGSIGLPNTLEAVAIVYDPMYPNDPTQALRVVDPFLLTFTHFEWYDEDSYDGSTPGSYRVKARLLMNLPENLDFTSPNITLPSFIFTVQNPTISEFDLLPDNISRQNLPFSLDYDLLFWPQTVYALVSCYEHPLGQRVQIPVDTWQAPNDFDSEVPGEYIFTAVFSDIAQAVGALHSYNQSVAGFSGGSGNLELNIIVTVKPLPIVEVLLYGETIHHLPFGTTMADLLDAGYLPENLSIRVRRHINLVDYVDEIKAPQGGGIPIPFNIQWTSDPVFNGREPYIYVFTGSFTNLPSHLEFVSNVFIPDIIIKILMPVITDPVYRVKQFFPITPDAPLSVLWGTPESSLDALGRLPNAAGLRAKVHIYYTDSAGDFFVGYEYRYFPYFVWEGGSNYNSEVPGVYTFTATAASYVPSNWNLGFYNHNLSNLLEMQVSVRPLEITAFAPLPATIANQTMPHGLAVEFINEPTYGSGQSLEIYVRRYGFTGRELLSNLYLYATSWQTAQGHVPFDGNVPRLAPYAYVREPVLLLYPAVGAIHKLSTAQSSPVPLPQISVQVRNIPILSHYIYVQGSYTAPYARELGFNYGACPSQLALSGTVRARVRVYSSLSDYTYEYRQLSVNWNEDIIPVSNDNRFRTVGLYTLSAYFANSLYALKQHVYDDVAEPVSVPATAVTIRGPQYIIQWFYIDYETNRTGPYVGHMNHYAGSRGLALPFGTAFTQLGDPQGLNALPALRARVHLYNDDGSFLEYHDIDIDVYPGHAETRFGTVNWGQGQRLADGWDDIDPRSYFPADGRRTGVFNFTPLLQLPCHVQFRRDGNDEIVLTPPSGLPLNMQWGEDALGFPADIAIQVMRPNFDGNLIVTLPNTGSGDLYTPIRNATHSLFAYYYEIHTVTVQGGNSFTITASGGDGSYLNAVNWPILDTLNLNGFLGNFGVGAFWNNESLVNVSLRPGAVLSADMFRENAALSTIGFCAAATSVDLGNLIENLVDLYHVSQVGSWAFADSAAISAIRLARNLPSYPAGVFNGLTSLQLVVLTSPTGSQAAATTFGNIPRQVMLLRDESLADVYVQQPGGFGIPGGFGAGRFANLSNMFGTVGETATVTLQPNISGSALGLLDFTWQFGNVDGTGNFVFTENVPGSANYININLVDYARFAYYRLRIEFPGGVVHYTLPMRFANIETNVLVTIPSDRPNGYYLNTCIDGYPLPHPDEYRVLHHDFGSYVAGYIWNINQFAEFRVYNLGNLASGIPLTNVEVFFAKGLESPFILNRDLVIGTTMTREISPGQMANVRVWPRLHLFPSWDEPHYDYLIIRSTELDGDYEVRIRLEFTVVPHDVTVAPDGVHANGVWRFPDRTAGYILENRVISYQNYAQYSGSFPGIEDIIAFAQFNITNNTDRDMFGISAANIFFELRDNSPFVLYPRAGGLFTGDSTGIGGNPTTNIVPGATTNVRVAPRHGLPISPLDYNGQPIPYRDTLRIRGQDGFEIILTFEFVVLQPQYIVDVTVGTGTSSVTEQIHTFPAVVNTHGLSIIFPERGAGYIFIDDSSPATLLGSRQINLENLGDIITDINWYFASRGPLHGRERGDYFQVHRDLMSGIALGANYSTLGEPLGESLPVSNMLRSVNAADMLRQGNIRISPVPGLGQAGALPQVFSDVFVIYNMNYGFRLEIPVYMTVVEPYFDVRVTSAGGVASSPPDQDGVMDIPTVRFASRYAGYFAFHDNYRINNDDTRFRAGARQINFRNHATTGVSNLTYDWESVLDGTNSPGDAPFVFASRGLRIGTMVTTSNMNIPRTTILAPYGTSTADTTLLSEGQFQNNTANLRIFPRTGLAPGVYYDYIVLRGDFGFEKRVRVVFEVLQPRFDIAVTSVSIEDRNTDRVTNFDPDPPYNLLPPPGNIKVASAATMRFPSRQVGYGEFFAAVNQWYTVNLYNGHRQIVLENLGTARVSGVTPSNITWASAEDLNFVGPSPFVISRTLTAYSGTATNHRLREYIPPHGSYHVNVNQLWIAPIIGLPAGTHEDYLIIRGSYGFELWIPVEFTVTEYYRYFGVSPSRWHFTARDEGYRLTHGIDAAEPYRTGFAQFNLSNWDVNNDVSIYYSRQIIGDGGIASWDGISALPQNTPLRAGSGSADSDASVDLRFASGVHSPYFIIYRGLTAGHDYSAVGTAPFNQGNLSYLPAAQSMVENGQTIVIPSLGNVRVMPRFGLTSDGWATDPDTGIMIPQPRTYEDELIITTDQGHEVRIPLSFTVHPRPGLQLHDSGSAINWDRTGNSAAARWGLAESPSNSGQQIPLWSFAPVFENYGIIAPASGNGAIGGRTWSLMETGGDLRGVPGDRLSVAMFEINNIGRDRVYSVTAEFGRGADSPFYIQRGLHTSQTLTQAVLAAAGAGNRGGVLNANGYRESNATFLQAYLTRVGQSGEDDDFEPCCILCNGNCDVTLPQDELCCIDCCCLINYLEGGGSQGGSGGDQHETVRPRVHNYRIRPRAGLQPGVHEDVFIVRTEHGTEIEIALRFEVLPLELAIAAQSMDIANNIVGSINDTARWCNYSLAEATVTQWQFQPRQVGFVPSNIVNDAEAGMQQFNLINNIMPGEWGAGAYRHSAVHPTLRFERLQWQFESVLQGGHTADSFDSGLNTVIPGTSPFVISRELRTGDATDDSGSATITEHVRGRSASDWHYGIWANVAAQDRTVPGIWETGRGSDMPPVSNIRVEPRLGLGMYRPGQPAINVYEQIADYLIIWNPLTSYQKPLMRIPLRMYLHPFDISVFSGHVRYYSGSYAWNSGFNWYDIDEFCFGVRFPSDRSMEWPVDEQRNKDGAMRYGDVKQVIIQNNGAFPLTGLELFSWLSVEEGGNPASAAFFVEGLTLFTGDSLNSTTATSRVEGDNGRVQVRISPRAHLAPGVHEDTLFIRNIGGIEFAIPVRVEVAEYTIDFSVEEFLPRENGFMIDLAEDTRIITFENRSTFPILAPRRDFMSVPRDGDGNVIIGYDPNTDLISLQNPNSGNYFNIEGGQIFDHWNRDGGYRLNPDSSTMLDYNGEPIRFRGGFHVDEFGNYILEDNQPRPIRAITVVNPGQVVFFIIRMHEGLGEGHFREYLRVYNEFHFEVLLPLDFTVIRNLFVILSDTIRVDFGTVYFGAGNIGLRETISLTNAGNTSLSEYGPQNFTFDRMSGIGMWDPNPVGVGAFLIPPGHHLQNLGPNHSIGVGESRHFSVAVREEVSSWPPGLYTAILEVRGRDGEAEPLHIEFLVRVLEPSADISRNSISFDPAGVGYSAQDVLDREQTITIRNLMQSNAQPVGALTGVSYRLEGPDMSAFVVSAPGTTVNNTGTFSIRPITGLLPGTYTAFLYIDFDHSSSDFNGRVELSFTVMPIQGQVQPTAHVWLPRAQGYSRSEADTFSFTVQNTCTLWPMTISSINLLSGAHFERLSVGAVAGTVIPPQGTAQISIRPMLGLPIGIFNDTLVVTASAGAYSITMTAAVYFSVIEPGVSLNISPGSLTWSSVGYGYSERQLMEVRVTNTGDRLLENISAAVIGSNFEVVGTSLISQLAPFNRAADYHPGLPHYAVFTLRPINGLAPGMYNDSVIISTPAHGTFGAVSLYFNVLWPQADTSPLYKTWDSRNANYAPITPQRFSISNVGDGVLTNVRAVLSSANFEFVGSSINDARTVKEGGSTSWYVRPRTGLVPSAYVAYLIITADHGIEFRLPLSFEVTYAFASVNPTIFNWGNVTAGYLRSGTPAARFRVTNLSNYPIDLLDISLSSNSPFELPHGAVLVDASNSMISEIPGGGSAYVIVQPRLGLGLGSFSDYLVLGGRYLTFDEGMNIRIPLSVNVVAPTAVSNPAGHDFFATVGYIIDYDVASLRQSFDIVRSTDPYIITGITASFASGAASRFTLVGGVASIPASIAPGQTPTIQVQPIPGLMPGLYTDILQIRGDYGFVLDIPISFSVSRYNATAVPSPLELPSKIFGYQTAPVGVITVRSYESNTDLTGLDIRLSSGSSFEIVGTPATVLLAYGEISISIRPVLGLKIGQHSDTLLISSAAQDFNLSVGIVFEVLPPSFSASITPTMFRWNNVGLGYTVADVPSHTFGISNTGTGDLMGLSAQFRYGNAFTITAPITPNNLLADGTDIPAMASAKLSVRPNTGLALGSHFDVLVINDRYGHIVLEAQLHFTVSAFDVTINPMQWDFGQQVFDYDLSDLVEQAFTLTSLETFNLFIGQTVGSAVFGDVSLVGGVNSPFVITDISSHTLSSVIHSPANSSVITVRPDVGLMPGIHEDVLIVTGRAQNAALGTFTLAVPLSFEVLYPAFNASLTPNPLVLQTWDANDVNYPRYGRPTPNNLPSSAITLTNNGIRPITVQNVLLAGGNNSAFTVVNPGGLLGVQLGYLDSTELQIRPIAGLRLDAVHRDTLIIMGEDGFFITAELEFTVIGPEPVFSAEIIGNPVAVNMYVGQNPDSFLQRVHIRNTGTADILYADLSVMVQLISGGSTAFELVTQLPVSGSLNAGQQIPIDIRPVLHATQNVGTYLGSLEVRRTNIVVSNTLPLSLVVSSRAFTIYPAFADFAMYLNESPVNSYVSPTLDHARSFTITNLSAVPLTPADLAENFASSLFEIVAYSTNIINGLPMNQSGTVQVRPVQGATTALGTFPDVMTVSNVNGAHSVMVDLVLTVSAPSFELTPTSALNFEYYLNESAAAQQRLMTIRNMSRVPLGFGAAYGDVMQAAFFEGAMTEFEIHGWPTSLTLMPGGTTTFYVRATGTALTSLSVSGVNRTDTLIVSHRFGISESRALELNVLSPRMELVAVPHALPNDVLGNAPLEFSLYVGEDTSARAREVRIRNLGRGPLYFADMTPVLSGTNAAEFVLVTTWPTSGRIEAGGEFIIELRATDAARNIINTGRTATLTIECLYGENQQLELALDVLPINIELIPSAPLTFTANWRDDPANHREDIRIRNLSTRMPITFADLIIQVTQIIPGVLFELLSVPASTVEIAPLGQSGIFYIQPTIGALDVVNSAGREAQLNVENDLGDNRSLGLTLKVKATAFDIVVEPKSGLGSNPIEFLLYSGQNPMEHVRTIRIRAIGTVDLDELSIHFTGTYAGEFSVYAPDAALLTGILNHDELSSPIRIVVNAAAVSNVGADRYATIEVRPTQITGEPIRPNVTRQLLLEVRPATFEIVAPSRVVVSAIIDDNPESHTVQMRVLNTGRIDIYYNYLDIGIDQGVFRRVIDPGNTIVSIKPGESFPITLIPEDLYIAQLGEFADLLIVEHQTYSQYGAIDDRELILRVSPRPRSSGAWSITEPQVPDTAAQEDENDYSSYYVFVVEKRYAYVVGRGGNMFHPDDLMTRAEAVQMLYNIITASESFAELKPAGFPDVSIEAWYARAVNLMAMLGVIRGDPDGTFRPSDSITRAEFTAIITNFFGAKLEFGANFVDVGSEHWAYMYIGAAAAMSWITGIGENYFEPERPITRAEVVTITNRALNRVPDVEYIRNSLNIIRFYDIVGHWAYYEILEAAHNHYFERNDDGFTQVLMSYRRKSEGREGD